MAVTPSWSQCGSELTVRFLVGAGAKRDETKVSIDTSKVAVWIAGKSIFSAELAGKVDKDESYWQLEGSGDARALVVTLCKKKSDDWKGLTKEEAEQVQGPGVMDVDFETDTLAHDDDDPERVEEQEENERKLEARYKMLLEERGLEDEETLKTFFALFDNCIQLYRLNKMSNYLETVVPACRKRNDKYKLKAIQALAFVRWKQSKFREALPIFHEMEGIVGKGAALCENIAHTYNSLGDYEKAEDYFRQSLKFIESESGSNNGNRGGVLLGLGLVRDRLGRHEEALPVIKKAYDFYKDRARGQPASLQAKAGTSYAKVSCKLGRYAEGEKYMQEAVTMYEITCGETSPLTASAYFELGKCQWAQRKREAAQKSLKRGYEIESQKDAWDLVGLLEIHNLLMDTHLKETTSIDRKAFQQYFKIVDYVCGRVRKDLKQDGNAAVYYKAAAELKAWGGEYSAAKELFHEAIGLFEKETSVDTTGLIGSCNDMLAFCDRNLAGTQDSPMAFNIAENEAAVARQRDANQDSEPIIEELPDDEEVVIEEEKTEESAAEPAPKPTAEVALQYREVVGSDFQRCAGLCASCGASPKFSDPEKFRLHVERGAGRGLCWVAMRGESLVGMLVCGSDGLDGHVLQLVVADHGPSGELQASSVRKVLLARCASACRGAGLLGLQCAVVAGSSEDGAFADLEGGWAASTLRVHRQTFGGAAADTRTPASASASAAPASRSLPSREPPNAQVEEEEPQDFVPPPRRAPDDFPDAGELVPSLRLSRFSWDQSDRFVTIYIPVPDATELEEESIEVHFKPRALLVTVLLKGKRQWFKVPSLCKDIVPATSSKKVKGQQVVVKLRKEAERETWSDLTGEEDERQRRRQQRIDHGDLKGASTEELLADMYRNASDEDRAGLRDAMRVNRQKREAEGTLKVT